MNKEDILTLKAVILYILKHSKEDRRDVYGVVKTAYYAQQKHLAEWALPLYKDRIAALPFGPVPSSIYNILKIARGDQKSSYLSVNGFSDVARSIGFSNERFFAIEEPDMDYLSESNIQCIDSAIERVSGMDFYSVMTDTHRGEWARAKDTNTKTMEALAIAKEGGASDEALEYLAEHLELESILN